MRRNVMKYRVPLNSRLTQMILKRDFFCKFLKEISYSQVIYLCS